MRLHPLVTNTPLQKQGDVEERNSYGLATEWLAWTKLELVMRSLQQETSQGCG